MFHNEGFHRKNEYLKEVENQRDEYKIYVNRGLQRNGYKQKNTWASQIERGKR